MKEKDAYKLYTAALLLKIDPIERIENAGVLVKGATIEWAGPLAEFPAQQYPADLVKEDLGDVTLLPGLIDSHVHLGFDGGPHPVERMKSENDVQQTMLMLRSARELLSVGVTTARDLGARGYLDVFVRRAIDEGTAWGPRLLTAGSPLTVTGGHCWFMGGEVDDEYDARKMVRQHHKMGVDLIKVMSTGGFMTHGSAPWFAQFTEVQLHAIVEEAHRLGKRVAAHCHGVQGIQRAVNAGVDTLEHCSFVHPDGRHEVVPELADQIAASHSYVSPTTNFRVALMMKYRDYTPAVAELYRRGAKVIMSTDSGIDNTPHYGFVGGMESLNMLGLPISEVLTAATARAAEALGISDVTGRVQAGYSADLIAVHGDPSQDLAALHRLKLVIVRGEEFQPDPLPPLPGEESIVLPSARITKPAELLDTVTPA